MWENLLYWHSTWTHANTQSLDLTKAIYSQSGTSFMMIALKGRISIYNEGSFCRPSLSILYLILVHVQWCFNYFVFSSFILTVLCAKNICKKDFFRKYFILCYLHDLLCIVHCFICVCVCVFVCVGITEDIIVDCMNGCKLHVNTIIVVNLERGKYVNESILSKWMKITRFNA